MIEYCRKCHGYIRQAVDLERFGELRGVELCQKCALAQCYNFNVRLHEDSMSKHKFKMYYAPDPRLKLSDEKPVDTFFDDWVRLTGNESYWWHVKRFIYIQTKYFIPNCKKLVDRIRGRK